MRQRQEAAAAALDAALVDVMKQTPQGVVTRDAISDINAAHMQLREAWSRSTVLADSEIERRMNALDMALHMAGQDVNLSDQPVNLWPLTVAFSELRRALAAFQRREQPPAAEFPTAKQMIGLAHPGGRTVGLEGITDDLIERGVTG